MVNKFTMAQTKTLSNRTDKDLTNKEKTREHQSKESAKKTLAKTNPKIDGNVIKGYN